MGREAKVKRARREQQLELSPQEALNAEPPTAAPWNTRYLEYARAHERSPEAMLALDRERFPGGKMAGFIIWAGARWAEWRTANGKKQDDPLTDAEQAVFDAWLKGWVDEQTSRIIKPRPAEIVRPG